MPYVDIDVDDFLESLRYRDIEKVIEWLRDNDHLGEEDLLDEIDTPRSYTSNKFEEALLKLRGHSTSLTTEEEEYIINLSKRING
jgi:hypothetical protein